MVENAFIWDVGSMVGIWAGCVVGIGMSFTLKLSLVVNAILVMGFSELSTSGGFNSLQQSHLHPGRGVSRSFS